MDEPPVGGKAGEDAKKKRGGQPGQRGPYKKKSKMFVDLTVATSSTQKVENDKLLTKSAGDLSPSS